MQHLFSVPAGNNAFAKNSRELKRAAESASGYGLVWPATLVFAPILPC